jgi:hypothetical protein
MKLKQVLKMLKDDGWFLDRVQEEATNSTNIKLNKELLRLLESSVMSWLQVHKIVFSNKQD